MTNPALPLRRLGPSGVLFLILLPLLALLWARSASAEPAQPRKETTLDAAQRARIIDRLAAALNEQYVFPETAKKMEARLRERLKAGAYDRITRPQEFEDVVTGDMRAVSKDGHLSLLYTPVPLPTRGKDPQKEAAEREKLHRMRAEDNFGFERLEHLTGNVGYLDLRGFDDPAFAGETASAAMNFLANSDAVIIDLRQNHGGKPEMVQLISSYFFDEPTHLNDFFIREGNKTKQFWTSAHVAGKRMTDKDVYILTSHGTFSAGEEFCYDFQNLKRGTLVGETTGGGAHPVHAASLPDVPFAAAIPFGRAVNPITHTNWEGTGVKPDVAVPAAQALQTAHELALKKLLEKAQDAERKQALAWDLEQVRAQAQPVSLSPEVMKAYAGTYGAYAVTLENDALWLQLPNKPKLRLLPMTKDVLLPEGISFVRVRFDKDAAGKVTGLTSLFQDGSSEPALRTGN